MNLQADTATLQHLEEHLGGMRREEVGKHTYFVGASKVTPTPHPVAPKLASALQITTLQGFARFIANNVDDLDLLRHVIIAGPDTVQLYGALDDHRQRELVLCAAHNLDLSWLGTWVPLAEMLIKLGAFFDASGDRDTLIKLLGNVSVKEATVQKREGLGFRISADHQLDGDGWESVENPLFELAPYRAFPEAFDGDGQSQIASTFVLDVRAGTPDRYGEVDEKDKSVFVRLVQADGNLWAPQAGQAVADRLEQLLVEAAEAVGADRSQLPFIAN